MFTKHTEEQVLGIILAGLQPEYFLWAISFQSKDFSKLSHKYIHEAIVEIRELGEVPDIVNVSNLLENKGLLKEVGGRRYINELALAV